MSRVFNFQMATSVAGTEPAEVLWSHKSSTLYGSLQTSRQIPVAPKAGPARENLQLFLPINESKEESLNDTVQTLLGLVRTEPQEETRFSVIGRQKLSAALKLLHSVSGSVAKAEAKKAQQASKTTSEPIDPLVRLAIRTTLALFFAVVQDYIQENDFELCLEFAQTCQESLKNFPPFFLVDQAAESGDQTLDSIFDFLLAVIAEPVNPAAPAESAAQVKRAFFQILLSVLLLRARLRDVLKLSSALSAPGISLQLSYADLKTLRDAVQALQGRIGDFEGLKEESEIEKKVNAKIKHDSERDETIPLVDVIAYISRFIARISSFLLSQLETSKNIAATTAENEIFALGSNANQQLGSAGPSGETTTVYTTVFDKSIKVAHAGSGCTHFLTDDGHVFALGKGDYGRLGIDNTSDTNTPTELTGEIKNVTIVKVANSKGNYGHGLAIDSQGGLWSWGDGDFGKLGHGDTSQRPAPVKISFFNNKIVTDIACGYKHSICMTDDGTVYTWGGNDSGAVGDGTTSGSNSPQKITLEGPAKNVFAGAYTSFVVLESGQLVGWGLNDEGELGVGHKTNVLTPHTYTDFIDPIIFVAGGENHTLFLDAKQNVFISGSISTADATKPTTPLELEGKKVSYIASGPHYAYAVVDNDVYGWGNANDSQLGSIGNQSSPTINDDLSGRNIQYISAGLSHVFFCTKGESILKANLVKSFLPLVVEANAETFVALNKLVAGLKEKAETATEYDEDVLDIVNYHLFIANIVGLDKQADFLQQLRSNLSDLLYVPKFSAKTQKIFQTNWNIMLPSVEERTKVALESIPKSEQECKDFQGTQRFLFEIIVSSLPKSPHFASALGLLNGADIDIEALPDKFARTLDFLRSVILCSKFHNFSFIAGLANGSLDDAAIAAAPSTASSYEGLLTYLTKFILAKQFVNSEKPDLVLYNNDLISQTVAILLHHSIELVEFVLQITSDNPALEEATLNKISETLERTVLRNSLCLMVYSVFNLKIETAAKYEQELIQLLGLLDRLSRKLYGESHRDFEKQELSWPASAVENDHYKTPFWLIEIEQALSLSLGNLAVQQIESTPLSDQEKDETLAVLIKQRLFSNGIDLDKQPGRYYEFTDDLVSGSNEGAILVDLVEDFATQKMLSVSLPMDNESFRKVMRLALACLLKHHGLVSVAYMYAQNVEAHAPPKKLVPIFSKLYLLVLEPLSHKVQPPDEVKGKEEEKDFPSIETICEPIIKRLEFLLYNLRAATLTEELIAEPAPAPATGRLSLTSTMPDILSTGRSRLTSSAINYGSSGSSSSSSSSSAFSDDSQPRALGLGQSLRRASSFSRESKRNKKSAWKPLTSIISTLRRFQWMQSSGIQTAQEKNTLIGQIAEFIFKDQLSLDSLEQALTAQQVRAEQRIKGLKFLYSLISREHIFDSVRLHSIRSCFRFIFPASTMVSFRSNIEASPCDTQQSIETLTINIHKNLCSTVVSAINTLSKIVEIENLEEADAELKASVNCQSWLVLYAIKSLTVKLSARETDNIVESGILDALSLILNPNKTSAARTFFEPLTKHSRRLLRVILSAMGTLTSDLKESTLKRLDTFLLKTVRASSEAPTPEGLHALLSYIHDSSVSSKFKQLLSSPSWTDLYFKLINESTLQVRLLTLRLLNSLLSSWKTTQQGVKRYAGILQQLFRSLAYHLTFPTVKVPSIECSGQAFAWDSTTALKCTTEDTTVIQTESCSISEPGYVLGAFPLSAGRYEMEFESAIDSATDETICIGLSRQNPRSPGFENSPDMWIYRAYNGEIYHSGRVGTIDKWTVGDKMLMEVDLDQNTLTFSKNGVVQDCSGFRDSHAIESGLFPIILFYGSSTRINIKVNSFISPTVVSDSQPKVPKHVDPRFSPPVLNLAEELVSTLRTLLKSSDWARLINSFVSTQLRNIPRTLTYISTSEESKVPIKLSDSVNEDTYVGSLMSVLGLFSNFSDSFRIGSLCVSPSKGEAFVQNYTSSTSGILATHLESENIMNDAIFKLTHVPSSPFDFEKLSSPDSEVQNLFSLIVPIEQAQSLERQKLSLLALKTLATMVQLAPQVHKLLIAHPDIVTRSINKAATTQPLRNGFEIDVLEKLSIVLQLEIKYRIENPTPEPDPEAEKKEEEVKDEPKKKKKDEAPAAEIPTSPVFSRGRRSSIGPADVPTSPVLSRGRRSSIGPADVPSSEDDELAAAIRASLLESSPPRVRRSSIGPADAPSTPPSGRRSSIGPADAPSTPGRRSSIGPVEEDDELAAAIEASLRAAAVASPLASPAASPRRAISEESDGEALGFGLFGSDSESNVEDLFGSSSPKPKKKADAASNKKGKAPKKDLTFDEYSKKVLIEESDSSQSAPSFEDAVKEWEQDAETITAFKSALKFKSLGSDDDSGEPVVAGPNPAKVSRKSYNLARKIIASAKSIEQLQSFLFKVHQSLEIMYSRQLITTLIQMDPKVEDKRILDTESLEEDLKTKIALIILLTAAKRSGSKAYSAFGKIIKTVLQNSPSVSKMLVASCLTNLVNASRKSSKDGHYASDLEAATTPSFAESKYLLDALVQDLSSIKKKSWIQNMSSALSACIISTHLKPEDREFSAVQLAKLLKNVKARSPELLAKLKEQNMIKKLLEQAPIILKKQYKHESGINKGFTAFVKNLAMALMSLEAKETLESTEGLEWLEQFSTSFLMLEAMANRNPFPEIFLKSLEKDINDDSRPALDNKLFTKELDQLLQDWRNKRPTDLVSMCDVFGFGESERSQLSGTESLSSPTVRPDFSVRAPRNVYLGERCSFIEPEDGKILAIGCGSYGRLGVGNNDDASDFKNLQCDVLFRIVMCSKGGYGHSVAIDHDKKLWSWGDGDYGKLGQGDTDHRNKPTLIPSLSDKDFIAASCGFRHSAAVDVDGAVWTWGQCDNGKLGSDTSDNRSTPETVSFSEPTKIKFVSCSSNQTFAVSEDGEKVFAFGSSGTPLGTIEFSDVTTPVEVSFEHAPIVKIESGESFTICLDSEGKLYGWGSESNVGLNDVYATNISESLSLSVVFKDIAVGNNFALALTDDFQVWSVGPSPQVGRSDDTDKWSPIEQFSDGKKKSIAAGSNHAIVFYAPVEGVEPPPKVPPEYAALEQVPAGSLRLRVQILSKFSKYLSASLALVDFENEKKILQIVKSIVQTSTKIELLNKVLDSSSVSDTGGSIRLNRYLATVSKNKTIFAQAAEQLLTRSPADLRQSGRVWSCEFIGEAAADAGGPYNESISQMVEELNGGSTPCLQISPNGRAAIGVNQDRLVAKPGASVRALRLFKFLGVLFGIAIRTHHPMALFIARPFWKQLVGDELTPQDLKDVDEPHFKLLDCLKDMQDSGVDEDTFLDFLDRVPDSFPPLLQEDGTKMHLKLENIAAYRELAIARKLHETDNEFKSIREGLDMVVPLTALSLFTSAEIEKLICGDETIDWELLKKNTDYSDYSASDQPIVWLWDVLENEFSVAEGVLFLRFCWGRTRLPKNANDWGRRFQINSMDEGVADNYLPKAVTCFFKFLLPRYTSREILLKRLRTAIAYTSTIETDEYSRRELDMDELNRAAIEEDDE